MTDLARLLRTHAGPGQVRWIGLRRARRAAPEPVSSCDIGADGLAGDHGRPGKRAVTLIQHEHLPVITALSGRDSVTPELLRRNIVVSGLNLSALRNRTLHVGSAVLRITGPCAPCSRMEEALGPGGYTAMRGHGGWCAEVVEAGHVALDDLVCPEAPTEALD